MAHQTHNNSKAKTRVTAQSVVWLGVLAQCGLGCSKETVIIAQDYGATNCVNIALGKRVEERGLYLVTTLTNSVLSETRVGPDTCRSLTIKHGTTGYIAFRLDPRFKAAGLTNVAVTVEYFDDTFGDFTIEYDGFDRQIPDRSEKGELRFAKYHHGEYTGATNAITLERSQKWQASTIHLPDVRFENSQDGNADFRLKISGRRFLLRSVSVCVE